jgi:YwiC-like protein
VLLPREHGAYGQLLFPLLSSLLIGRPSAGAYLLAASAVAAFLAHEGLLVVLGQRGSRAARDGRADAWRSLALFGGFCAVTGTVSLVVLSFEALSCLLVPLGLGVLVAVAVFAHRERSTAGELLVATALSSVSLPVAIAGGVPHIAAVTLFIVFAAGFVTATVAVRAMIGRVSRAGGPHPGLAIALTLAILAGLAVAAEAGRLASVAPFAALPVCAVCLALSTRPPAPRYLRSIGWTLVGATALTAVILVAALA